MAADTLFVFVIAAAFLGLTAVFVYAVSVYLRKSSLADLSPKAPLYYWLLWGAFSVAGGILAMSMPVHFSGDTPVYLRHAISLLESGQYALPGTDPWNATVRTPGYPAFLLVTLVLGVRSLGTVVLIQYLIHALSIGLLGSLLARMADVRDGLIIYLWFGVFLGLSLLGLPHVFFNAAILSDGLCASLILFSVYYFLSYKLDGSRLALLGFALSVGAASMVRPVAIIALVLLLPEVLRSFYRLKIRQVSAMELLLVVMGLLLGAAPTLGWSARNYVQYGFFAPSS